MAPRNNRIAPDTEVRSPARSLLRSLDNFEQSARDTRGERAIQDGFSAFGAILADKADELNDDQYHQGVRDAHLEAAGQEIEQVKKGTLFRQHSKYYMRGLNETRGKAAAAKWKSDLTLAYNEWEGKHTDDDGSAFTEWMNAQVGTFMQTLGEDRDKIAGALPVVSEVSRNWAAQHTGFTAQRLERESFEAYDEIVSGVFSGLSQGEFDLDTAASLIAGEADDMYATDGAKANDRVVEAAIRYSNIHNDPDALLALAKAHDSGKLKLSQKNREKLANAMDAVEADIERDINKQAKRDDAELKAQRTAALNEWGNTLQRDPYADLPTFSDVGDNVLYSQMVKMQDMFINSSDVQNPRVAAKDRMLLEGELHNAETAGSKISILNEFINENPRALSAADVAKYTREILATQDPGSLINDQTVKKYRQGFSRTLSEFQLGDGFDLNRSSFLATQGERHFNDYMLSQSGRVDMNDPSALRTVIKEAEEYAIEQLSVDFPEVLSEKNDQSNLGESLGVPEALERRKAEADEIYRKALEGVQGEAPGDISFNLQPEDNPGLVIEDAPLSASAGESVDGSQGLDTSLEEEGTPFEDPDSEVEYAPAREGFYGKLIHGLTDGRDNRGTLANATSVLRDNPEFRTGVERLASKYSVPTEALMAIMHFETGGSFSASVKNAAGSGATGLIQFMPKTAVSLGTTTQELSRMTEAEQLVYVEKYFDQFGSRIQGGNVDDLYMAVLWPKAIGKPDGYPIFRSGTTAYRQNAGLDHNKDGTVTKYEAASKVRRIFYGY